MHASDHGMGRAHKTTLGISLNPHAVPQVKQRCVALVLGELRHEIVDDRSANTLHKQTKKERKKQEQKERKKEREGE
jgi:hypothetical protein